MSRESFEEFTSDKNYIVISITDPNSEPIESQKGYKALLSLQFHDIDERVTRKDCKCCDGTGIMNDFLDINGGHCYACTDKMDVVLFNERDAEQILDFVDAFKDSVDTIVCQCEAGISRSAGVAGALAKIYNGNDQYYFDNYIPNMRVYRTILNKYQERLIE